MPLMNQLRQALQAYATGRATRRQTESWIALHAQAIASSSEPDLQQFEGRASSLLAELAYGTVREDEVRAELRQILSQERATPDRV